VTLQAFEHNKQISRTPSSELYNFAVTVCYVAVAYLFSHLFW